MSVLRNPEKFLLTTILWILHFVTNDIFTFVCHSERSEESQTMWYQRLVRFFAPLQNDIGKIMSFSFIIRVFLYLGVANDIATKYFNTISIKSI